MDFFFFYTIIFWAILNCFLFLFFCCCGIPEYWLFSTRETAGKNVLLYTTLLNMTEQLYTKWGFTKLPNGFCRLEYFDYMQPSYFRRIPKYFKTITTVSNTYKMYPWGGWYWGRTYKHKKLYGIAQGSSIFLKNTKYSTFDPFLNRFQSSILFQNRLKLSQNISHVFYNDSFFEKQNKQINDFYDIMTLYETKKNNPYGGKVNTLVLETNY